MRDSLRVDEKTAPTAGVPNFDDVLFSPDPLPLALRSAGGTNVA